MSVTKFISPLIASQFPAFYRDQGLNFIAFLEAYYEWMESQGNVIDYTRSMSDLGDIDLTTAEFIGYFKNKYIHALPDTVVADKRLLVKHIIELYRSKGNARSYKLLFRMLFNEDIDLYIPNEFLFKPSDSQWFFPHYIEVSDSPFLGQLAGHRIYSTGGASADVESYFSKIVNGKTVDILYLSSIDGEFKYGEEILSYDFPDLNITNCPIIFGSLSTVSVTSGGYNYTVGDLLNVNGSGVGGVARVASTRDENGKVTFKLIDGGYGFSLDALISVTGGGGSGATFKIGNITDTQVYQINTDLIDGIKDTLLEIETEGFDVSVTSSSSFDHGEQVKASANVRHLDVTYISGEVTNNEVLSNTSLGISNLNVYNSDGTVLNITSTTNSYLLNANLVSGVILVSSVSSSLVRVNTAFPLQTITCNAYVNAYASTPSGNPVVHPTILNIINESGPIGYVIPGSRLVGQNGYMRIATVNTVTRNTIWGDGMEPYFPAGFNPENLDSKLGQTLRYIEKKIGRITYINGIIPGIGYSSNPTVEIVEPYVYDLKINDSKGGYWGYDAVVTAKAGVANGIVTGVNVYDSGLGYIPDENITMTSTVNPTVVTGTTVVDLGGHGAGYSKDSKSNLSNKQKLQDSSYYQAFSYEIIAPRMIDTYEKFVKDLVHPSGMALYGRYSIKSVLTEAVSAPVSFSITQSS